MSLALRRHSYERTATSTTRICIKTATPLSNGHSQAFPRPRLRFQRFCKSLSFLSTTLTETTLILCVTERCLFNSPPSSFFNTESMASPLTDIPPELKTTSSTSSSDKSEKTRISAPAEDLLPPLDEKPRFTDLIFHRSKFRAHDPKGIATRRSVYDDPQLAKHYWPSEKYENLHRFDPKARWTFEEEAVSAITLL